jgi:ribosomal protein L11 methyltransferase
MKWIAAHVTLESPEPDLAIDLVADIFYALDLTGVVVDDPHIDPGLDWGDDALPPPDRPGVTGYFVDTPQVADRCSTLETALERLKTSNGITARVTYSRLDEEDWADAWKAYFWPQRITTSMVVKPSWRDYDARAEEIVLEIDPGMAFGTGTHPTTALCIAMIETHLNDGDAFLDVGTGSGILMIAAAKLGAADLSGVDSDAMALTVAEKNLLTNGIADFSLVAGNLVEKIDRTFDVVAANILAEIILDLLPDVVSVLKSEGILICSGIIAATKGAVLAGLQENGFQVIDTREKAGWVAVAARRTKA